MFTKNLVYKFASKKFDLAIIGGGPGGYIAAIKAGQLGLKTVCIEKREALGGTCLNIGCIPSKALLNISHKYQEAIHDFKNFGIQIQTPRLNWSKVQSTKNGIVSSLTKGIQGLFKKNNVTFMKGCGSFINKNLLQVTDIKGHKQEVEAKNIIVATGSQPIKFQGLQFDQKVIISSTGALSLPEVPEDLIVIGGGVIGLQLSSVYARFGTNVTVIEYLDQIVPSLDKQIAKTLHKILQKQGIKIMTSCKVIQAKNCSNYGQVKFQPIKGGQAQIIRAAHILISTGRKPYTQKLNLQKAGVKLDQKGRIIVNENLTTTIPNIYSIGDCVRGPMLAHKAQQEGIYAVQHIVHSHPHINYHAIPAVIYTYPQVAVVGYSEQQLINKKIAYKKGVFPFLANSRAKAISHTDGIVKILAQKQSNKILGAHIIGPGAGQMISEAVIGIQYGASTQDLARTCHAHPTLSEAFKQACMASYDRAIHF